MTTITTISRTRIQTSSAPDTTPIVFVVDDDVSVRESLELLIQVSGWRAASDLLPPAPSRVLRMWCFCT